MTDYTEDERRALERQAAANARAVAEQILAEQAAANRKLADEVTRERDGGK